MKEIKWNEIPKEFQGRFIESLAKKDLVFKTDEANPDLLNLEVHVKSSTNPNMNNSRKSDIEKIQKSFKNPEPDNKQPSRPYSIAAINRLHNGGTKDTCSKTPKKILVHKTPKNLTKTPRRTPHKQTNGIRYHDKARADPEAKINKSELLNKSNLKQKFCDGQANSFDKIELELIGDAQDKEYFYKRQLEKIKFSSDDPDLIKIQNMLQMDSFVSYPNSVKKDQNELIKNSSNEQPPILNELRIDDNNANSNVQPKPQKSLNKKRQSSGLVNPKTKKDRDSLDNFFELDSEEKAQKDAFWEKENVAPSAKDLSKKSVSNQNNFKKKSMRDNVVEENLIDKDYNEDSESQYQLDIIQQPDLLSIATSKNSCVSTDKNQKIQMPISGTLRSSLKITSITNTPELRPKKISLASRPASRVSSKCDYNQIDPKVDCWLGSEKTPNVPRPSSKSKIQDNQNQTKEKRSSGIPRLRESSDIILEFEPTVEKPKPQKGIIDNCTGNKDHQASNSKMLGKGKSNYSIEKNMKVQSPVKSPHKKNLEKFIGTAGLFDFESSKRLEACSKTKKVITQDQPEFHNSSGHKNQSRSQSPLKKSKFTKRPWHQGQTAQYKENWKNNAKNFKGTIDYKQKLGLDDNYVEEDCRSRGLPQKCSSKNVNDIYDLKNGERQSPTFRTTNQKLKTGLHTNSFASSKQPLTNIKKNRHQDLDNENFGRYQPTDASLLKQEDFRHAIKVSNKFGYNSISPIKTSIIPITPTIPKKISKKTPKYNECHIKLTGEKYIIEEYVDDANKLQNRNYKLEPKKKDYRRSNTPERVENLDSEELKTYYANLTRKCNDDYRVYTRKHGGVFTSDKAREIESQYVKDKGSFDGQRGYSRSGNCAIKPSKILKTESEKNNDFILIDLSNYCEGVPGNGTSKISQNKDQNVNINNWENWGQGNAEDMKKCWNGFYTDENNVLRQLNFDSLMIEFTGNIVGNGSDHNGEFRIFGCINERSEVEFTKESCETKTGIEFKGSIGVDGKIIGFCEYCHGNKGEFELTPNLKEYSGNFKQNDEEFEMKFYLNFDSENKAVYGYGQDDIGAFSIKGDIEPINEDNDGGKKLLASVNFVKRYFGKHSVVYIGYSDTDIMVIKGKWAIPDSNEEGNFTLMEI